MSRKFPDNKFDSIMEEDDKYDTITEEWDKYDAITEVLDQYSWSEVSVLLKIYLLFLIISLCV